MFSATDKMMSVIHTIAFKHEYQDWTSAHIILLSQELGNVDLGTPNLPVYAVVSIKRPLQETSVMSSWSNENMLLFYFSLFFRFL